MIKGILIDFGGTIDSDGIHWFDAFKEAYDMVADIPRDLLWDAYVHTERTLGRNPIIAPTDTFCKTLQTKLELQAQYLNSKGVSFSKQDTVLDYCYNKVVKHISTVSKPALERIKLPMVLRQHAHRISGVWLGPTLQRRNRISRSGSPQTRSPNLPLGRKGSWLGTSGNHNDR